MLPALIAAALGQAAPIAQSGDDDPFFFFAFLFVGGLYAIYWGWVRYRRYMLIRDTPTASVRSMPVGRVELEGTARVAEEPLEAPFTDEDCLYADWKIEEYRPDPDDNDDDWDTIASGTLATPFFLEDDTGRVLINADEGAAFDLSGEYLETISVDGSEAPPPAIAEFIGDDSDDWDLGSFIENPAGAIAGAFEDDGTIGHSSNDRRYTQHLLPVDESVYVFGGAQPVDVSEVPDREAGANEDLLAVGPDGGTDLFLISDRKEDALASHYSKMAPAAIVAGLAGSAIGLYFILDWYLLA